MGDIYSIDQSCRYLLTRAARHRREGRFDEAMALLARAKRQFGPSEEIELAFARAYDEMGCEEEACRAYLRIVREEGRHRAQALFHLAVASAQHADFARASSYFQAFAKSDRAGVSPEMAALLHMQLMEAAQKPVPCNRRERARMLEQRAVRRLHEGRICAAKRTIEKSLSLHPRADGYLLKGCCHLLLKEADQAIGSALSAHRMAPGRVQALCVLADAYLMAGHEDIARRTLFQAARRAKSVDSLLSVAVESAKLQENRITLILTKKLLAREPFQIKGMAIRACALTNLGNPKSAMRLFGRLCGLMPEDSVFQAHYKLLREGKNLAGQLSMAQDVPAEEAMERSMQLVALLAEDPAQLRDDTEALYALCRSAEWALHSPMAGANVTMLALVMLGALDTRATRDVLLDCLVDPRVDDGLKRTILQVMAAHSDETPVYADLGGRLVRLAAGASVDGGQRSAKGQHILQRAADVLMPVYPGAAKELLFLWVAYLDAYGPPKGRMEEACAAALEYTFHLRAGRRVSLKVISRKNNVSHRLAARCVRRMLHALEKAAAGEEAPQE